MSDENDIEYLSCGWIGSIGECVCSDEDDKSEEPVGEIKFNLCPQCGAVDNFEDLEEER